MPFDQNQVIKHLAQALSAKKFPQGINTHAFNQAIDEQIQQLPIVCQKSCDYCCYQIVDLYPHEANSLIQWLKDNLDTDALEHIKTQAEAIIQALLNTCPDIEKSSLAANASKQQVLQQLFQTNNSEQIKTLQLACPCLKDSLCLIYPMRPLICRSHCMTSDVDLCRENLRRPPCWQSRSILMIANNLIERKTASQETINLIDVINQVIPLTLKD